MLNDVKLTVKAMLKRSAERRAIIMFKQAAALGCGGERGGYGRRERSYRRSSLQTSGSAGEWLSECGEVASRRSADGAGAAAHAQIAATTAHRRKIIVNVQPVFHLTYRTDADFVKLRFNSKFAMKSKS